MVKLEMGDIPSLPEEVLSKLAGGENSSELKNNEDIFSKIVMRVASGEGIVFVDSKEEPKDVVYLMVGTYGVGEIKTCLILGSYFTNPDTSAIALSIKQYAKENGCKQIVSAPFSGESVSELWKHFKTSEEQTLKFHNI